MKEFIANGDLSITPKKIDLSDMTDDIVKYSNYYIGSRLIKERLSQFYQQDADCFFINYGIDLIIYHLLITSNYKKIVCFYPSYPFSEYYALLAKYQVIRCNLDNDGNYPQLIPAPIVSEKPEIVMITNPTNPGGKPINYKTVISYLEQLPKSLFIIDEAYIDFCNEYSFINDGFVAKNKNVIILRSFSKGYGLPGIRVGYAFSSNCDLIRKLSSTFFFMSSFSLKGALWCLDHQDYLNETIAYNVEIKKIMLNHLINYNIFTIIPTSVNFILTKIDSKIDLINFQNLCTSNGLIFWWFNETDFFKQYFGFPIIHESLKNCFRISCIDEREMNEFFFLLSKIIFTIHPSGMANYIRLSQL